MVAQLVRPAQGGTLALAECHRCPLRRNPVLGAGNPSADLVIVGEAPGYHETRRRLPFSGPSSVLFDQTLASVGMPPADVYTTNIVLCRSVNADGDDVPPPAEAVSACRARLLAELRTVEPRIIMSLGASAAKGLLSTRKGLNEIQGVLEYRDELPAPVLPTFHPAVVTNGNPDQFDDILSATKRAVKISTGQLAIPPRNETIPSRYLTKPPEITAVLQDIMRGKAGYVLGIDVETGGTDIISSPLLQISIGNTERGIAIEYSRMGPDNRTLLSQLLADPAFTWIIHNSSFDIQWFRDYFDAEIANITDTMCLALGTTERGEQVGLKRLSRTWLNAPYYEEEVHQYLNASKSNWIDVPRPILAKYAVADTVYTARMFPILDQLCEEEGTRELAYNLLMPAQRAFADIERYGVRVDRTYISQLAVDWVPKVEASAQAIRDYAREQGWQRDVPGKSRREKITTVEPQTVYEWVTKKGTTKTALKLPKNADQKDVRAVAIEVPKTRSVWVKEMVDEPLNPNSPPQLAQFLFDHLKLSPPPEGRKTGKEFRAAHPNHPFSALHGDYQLMNRMLNTYVRGITGDIRADGRVHPSFLLFGAVTGRLAMHNPPLQTIPREGSVYDKKTNTRKFDSIKRIFLPSSGFVWGESDFRQLELRVAWHLSEDEGLGEAIMSGDFHSVMASKLFGKAQEDVEEEERHASKTVTFGIMYGRQAPAIAAQIGCSVETAQGYIDGFFAAAPKYAEWYRAQHRNALENGRSTTPFGRVRRWNIITRENKQNVLNQAVNFPVQSTASDINLLAMIKLNQQFKDTGLGHVLFVVHDSQDYEVREGKEAEVAAMVRKTMTTWPFPSKAVLDIETKFGPSWGEVKEYEEAA